jgi:RNA polymerase sigma-70 factor (ECF subfamily)
MRRQTSPDFESLVEPYLNGLYRTACRLSRNPADAEDLVQDVCLAACQKLSVLRECGHPDRWLMRVLYNRFIDRQRRRDRSPVVPLFESIEPPAAVSGDAGPAELAEQGEREQAFARAFAKLEQTQRALLSLRAEGYGLADIEDITGIGRSVLRARLHRARQSLARHLRPDSAHEMTDPKETNAGEMPSRLGSGQ